MTHGCRIRTALATLALFACLPATGLSDGACGCNDICNLAKRLREKERLLEAARKVAAEAKDKVFPTAGWAKERFLEIAFPDGNYKVEGVQQYGQETKVSDELKKGNCDSHWKAAEAHELDHIRYDKTVPNWKYPWIMIFGQEGEFLAGKEVSGYLAEVEYLRKELEKLAKNCPPVDCDSSPVREQPVLETYQGQNAAAQAEQKQRLEGASRRVRGYAESIPER
ncbi:MAG: hypothetical protein ACE15E_06020 [Acidobacteriota bacterium]